MQTDHPVFRRAVQLAEQHKSTAKTRAGIIRFALGMMRQNLRTVRRIQFEWLGEPSRYSLNIAFPNRPPKGDAAHWKAKVQARRSHPDASRARDDAQFRRKYLRHLRREEVKITTCPLTPDGVTEFFRRKTARIARLIEIARLRSIATGKPPHRAEYVSLKQHPRLALIHEISPSCAREAGVRLIMRGGNARCLTSWDNWGEHSSGVTTWKNGKPVSYTRATHDNYVRAFGIIGENPRDVTVVIGQQVKVVTLSEGYQWAKRDGGLAVIEVATGEDYHPAADELWQGLHGDTAATLIARLVANRQQRLKEKARLVAEKAATEGVWVCAADSLRAGNCQAGTTAWARTHQFDPVRHHPAQQVLEAGLRNNDPGRVRLAISAAIHRHRREMEAGVCLLAEHQP